MTLDIGTTKKITIDFYVGAYGNTVRVDIRTRQELATIRALFTNLTNAKFTAIDLCKSPEFNVTNLWALILKVDEKPNESWRTVRRVESSARGPAFEWVRTMEGWLECVGLIEGLIEHDRAGHQYLSDASRDDALIEVAYMETQASLPNDT